MALPDAVSEASDGVHPPGGPSGPVPRRDRRAVTTLLVLAVVLLVAAVLAVRGHVGGGSALPTTASPPATASAPAHGYALDCLAVGAAVALGDRPASQAQQLFRQADEAIGPLTLRRSYDPDLPATFAKSAAGGDPAVRLHSFVSWKAPNGDPHGVIAGKYDRQIRAWAESVPRTGVFATSYHEPENNMTADEFVAYQRHVYTVVKAANPTIRWGPVYMAYWWDPQQKDHFVGDPQAWFPGTKYADFVGIDWYSDDPTPMTTSPSFTYWYQVFAPTHLPLVIPEYGQYARPLDQPRDPTVESARARAIHQDAEWIFGHPEFKAWIYWQTGGSKTEYRMRDEASRTEWQHVALSGCRP
jgi:hypothetical protein